MNCVKITQLLFPANLIEVFGLAASSRTLIDLLILHNIRIIYTRQPERQHIRSKSDMSFVTPIDRG